MRYQSSPSQDVRAGDRSCYSETNRDVAIVCILSRGDLFGHMVKDHSFPCDDCFCDLIIDMVVKTGENEAIS